MRSKARLSWESEPVGIAWTSPLRRLVRTAQPEAIAATGTDRILIDWPTSDGLDTPRVAKVRELNPLVLR